MEKVRQFETATNLAFIGSIKDDILDIEELAMGLLAQMQAVCPEKLAGRCKLSAQQLGFAPGSCCRDRPAGAACWSAAAR